MNFMGLNPKALIFSVVIHGLMGAGFMITQVFGKPDRPEFEIITVGLTAPAPKQVKKAPAPPPPAPKKEEEKPAPKPKTQKPKPEPPKEKVQPKETKTEVKAEKAPPKKESEPEPEYEYSETPSYAEGGATSESSNSSEDFSHAEFSGSFDSPGFEYPDWNYRGFEKIQREHDKRGAVFSTRALNCIVHFYVLRSGRIHSVTVLQSSGFPIYDRRCVEAVKRADPLPPLPASFDLEELGINLSMPQKL